MKRAALLIVGALIMSSCVFLQNHSHQKETPEEIEARKLDESIGQTEDEIIESRGAPDLKDNYGSFVVWIYRIDDGVTTKGHGAIFRSISAGRSESQQHFRQTRLYFKDGKLNKWDKQQQ